MMFTDTYRTIEAASQGSYREKASRFLSFAIPAATEQSVRESLEGLRKKYHDANHYCYAYCLGADRSAFRMNDDGEPSGSAGKPIFGQIQSKELTNILVVVVRYFGGTKLGIPGLIRAYRTAAREAIENAQVLEKTVNEQYEIRFPYPSMNEVMRVLKEEGASVLEMQSDEQCTISFFVRKNAGLRVGERMKKIRRAEIRRTGGQ